MSSMKGYKDLTKNEKKYLARFQCAWCDQRLDREECGAIYDKCNSMNRVMRLNACLSNYKPRNTLQTKTDNKDG